jgi:phage gp36-like protein
MFLSEDDYKTLIDRRVLDIVQQSDEIARAKAESMAVEEISGYLRTRYDVNKIFTSQGAERNSVIVMILIDITLYHLSSWLPARMSGEVRKERYDAAIKWLSGVQKGTIQPSLPTIDTDTDTDTGNPVKWGSATKNSYDY